MRARALAIGATCALLGTIACDGDRLRFEPGATASGAAVTTARRASNPTETAGAATATAQARGDGDDEASTKPVELLALKIASDVKNKEPVDAIDATAAGARVYAHVTIRNRTGRPRGVVITFTVDGVERARVPLEIGESWSWRTWGYATMRAADAGKTLTITLDDEEGHPLAERTLPVRSASKR